MADLMKKILIVDDNKEYLRIAMNYIIEESAPYAMLGASNGKHALEIAKNELPTIIIMDWEMPEKDGIETIKELKSDPETKDIPVIIATGIRLTANDLKTAFDAGASDFLKKPLEKTEFISRINSHAKLAEYIQEIKKQTQKVSEIEKQRMTDRLESLKNQIEENNIRVQFFNSLLNDLKKQLEGVSSENNSSKINKIISDLSASQNQILFDEKRMPDNKFVKKLLKNHPGLTPQEIQLSFMVMNGLSSKEISSQTFRELSSVRVARSRLRKKLGLETDDNLSVYLKQI